MRAEKQYITNEYLTRLNASPFFIVVDYRGLTVTNFTELRKRLRGTGSEVHVVKNSIFRVAAKESGVAELEKKSLSGQLAIVVEFRFGESPESRHPNHALGKSKLQPIALSEQHHRRVQQLTVLDQPKPQQKLLDVLRSGRGKALAPNRLIDSAINLVMVEIV